VPIDAEPSETAARRSVTDLGGLLRTALGLAWAASPRTVAASIALQVAVGIGTAIQLILARAVLADLLATSSGSPISDVWPLLTVLVVVTTTLALAAGIQSTLNLVMAEAVSVRAVSLVLDVATSVEPDVYEDPDFHDQLERARFNAVSRPVMAVAGLTGMMGAALGAGGVAVATLALDPLLVPIGLVSAVPASLASRANSRRLHRYMRAQTTDDRRRSYLMHLLSNRDLVKELRVYGMEAELTRRHEELHRQRLDRVVELARSQRRTSILGASLGAIGLFVAFGYLFWSIDRGRISLASAGTALFALLFLGQRLRGVVTSSGTLYEASLFLDDVAEFMALAPAPPASTEPNEGGAPPAPLPPFAVLKTVDLWFTYPGSNEPALCGVDLELRSGEVVALVGENGSGKTTLAKLLAGIYQPTRGRIQWDDRDLSLADPALLRRSVAVLFQDFVRLALTARDNVGLGAPARLDDQGAIEAAAGAVGADEVVTRLPGGWDQMLSTLYPDGTDLSGGQWQRLALARAMFRDAPFIIMDEPSSALDPHAEVQLLERMRLAASGRTVLFISHRFSSVRFADRIYVMHAGRLVEHGDHRTLVGAGGRYAEMYGLQASMYGLD
jgi:ATP-binding cassette subfamily B protein